MIITFFYLNKWAGHAARFQKGKESNCEIRNILTLEKPGTFLAKSTTCRTEGVMTSAKEFHASCDCGSGSTLALTFCSNSDCPHKRRKLIFFFYMLMIKVFGVKDWKVKNVALIQSCCCLFVWMLFATMSPNRKTCIRENVGKHWRVTMTRRLVKPEEAYAHFSTVNKNNPTTLAQLQAWADVG